MPTDRYSSLERASLEQRAGAAPLVALGAKPTTALAAAQVKLAAHGFDPGPADGAVKPQTTGALIAFQTAKKLPVTGTLDTPTLTALAKAPTPAGSMPAPARGGPIRVVQGPSPASATPKPKTAIAPKPVAPPGAPATPPPSVAAVVASAHPSDPVATHLATTGSLNVPRLTRTGTPPTMPTPVAGKTIGAPKISFKPGARMLPAASAGARPPMFPTRSGGASASPGGALAAPPPPSAPMAAQPMAAAPAGAASPRVSMPTRPRSGASAPSGTISGAPRASGSPTRIHTGGAPRASSSSPRKGHSMNATYENAGRRVPARFQSSSTIASLAQANIVVTPQIPFRGENVVVDSATAAFFSMREIKVGTWPQNAGGEADLPCTIFSPVQAGAVNYEMDLCDAGTQITLTVVNTDSAAHTFVGAIWGHEIKAA